MPPKTELKKPAQETGESKDQAAGHKDAEKAPTLESSAKDKQFEGPEKRKYFRYSLVYPSKKKVTLIISDYEFEVLDISRGGLKFLMHNGLDMDQQIQGIVRFSEKESRAITGRVVWKKGSYVGIKFNDLFPLFQLSFFNTDVRLKSYTKDN